MLLSARGTALHLALVIGGVFSHSFDNKNKLCSDNIQQIIVKKHSITGFAVRIQKMEIRQYIKISSCCCRRNICELGDNGGRDYRVLIQEIDQIHNFAVANHLSCAC